MKIDFKGLIPATVLPMTEEMRSLVMSHTNTGELRKQAIASGMMTLRAGGLNKVRDGRTTIEEVMRVTSSEAG